MSATTPCAACKLQRRKCTQECIFAPYFPQDQPHKFETVHKVFGASNVAKILTELRPTQRQDAVNSLAYEAEARLRDPVYGCVGLIFLLQNRLKQIQIHLYDAKKELATYIGPHAMLPILSNYPQPQRIVDAQQLAAVLAARDQQQLMRSYEQQQMQNQQHEEFVRFYGGSTSTSGFDLVGGNGFHQMNGSVAGSSNFVGNSGYLIRQQQQENSQIHQQIQQQQQENSQIHQQIQQQQHGNSQIHQQIQLQSHALIQQQQQLQAIPIQQKWSEGDEGRTVS